MSLRSGGIRADRPSSSGGSAGRSCRQRIFALTRKKSKRDRQGCQRVTDAMLRPNQRGPSPPISGYEQTAKLSRMLGRVRATSKTSHGPQKVRAAIGALYAQRPSNSGACGYQGTRSSKDMIKPPTAAIA